MARYAEEAPKLALGAIARLGETADLDGITHLIVASCTGFVAPGIDATLIKTLGLSPSVGRTQIGFMGCHGAFNGLRAAAAHTGAEPGAVALVVAVELCSLHFRYGWDPEKVVANALFADGAAAAVLAGAAHPGEARAGAWRLAASGSCLFPDSDEAMTWLVGDHGFEMTLSPRVPDLICSHLRPWLESWLRGRGLRLSDVKSWAIHPGGPRIVSSVVESLDLPDTAAAASNDILAQRGNMSSPTILFILDRLRREDAPRPCVALGFGPGLAAESALFI
jgi:predicted naringenin-chalcone synthase